MEPSGDEGSVPARAGGHVSARDAITSRRNVRQYADRPVSADDLDEILEAGRRSPSSKNTQPWDFVVVTDREQLARLAGVWVGGGHIASSAATIGLVVSQEDAARSRVQFDLGQAAMSIMIAAAGLGIGSCHSGIGDEELARELLGFPADRTCVLLISLGYPAGRPLAPIGVPDRRPFGEVVHRNHW
jgi:nitroreductase